MTKTKYIAFVDSDDAVNERMLEELMNDMITNEADISVCGYVRFSDNREIKSEDEENHDLSDCLVLSGPEVLPNLYHNFSAWGKVFKRNLFDAVRFPENELYEDSRTMYKLAGIAKRATVRSDNLYFYRYRPSSIMGTFSVMNYLDRVSVWDEIIAFLNGRVPQEVLLDAKRRKNTLICELICSIAKERALHTESETACLLLREIEDDAYKRFPPSLKVRAAIRYCRIVVR